MLYTMFDVVISFVVKIIVSVLVLNYRLIDGICECVCVSFCLFFYYKYVWINFVCVCTSWGYITETPASYTYILVANISIISFSRFLSTPTEFADVIMLYIGHTLAHTAWSNIVVVFLVAQMKL